MPAEVFDEQRRAWIAGHAGIFLLQKRRAELLGKKLRLQARTRAGARPDPHDDQVTPALVFRSPSTSTGGLETAVVAICAVVAPLGWLLGRMIYSCILTVIPEKLRAYPIPALLWAGVLCGMPLPLLYDSSGSLSSVLMVPWLIAQIPATFLAAAVYGILEGWLAVDGSSNWWPLTPMAADVDDDLLLGPGYVSMPTVLDPIPSASKPKEAPRRRTPARIQWFPILSGATIAAILIAWYCYMVLFAVLNAPLPDM